MVNLFKRKNAWYIEYYVTENDVSKRKRISLQKRGISNANDAKKYFAAFEHELRNQGLRSAGIKVTQQTSVSEAVEKYLEKYSRPYKAKNSYNLDLIIFNKHFLPLFGNKYVHQINKSHIEDYINKRIKIVKPVTVNREVDTIRSLFDKCMEWEYIIENPLKKIQKFKIETNELEILSPIEQDKLINSSAGYIKLAIVLALFTGMRKSEILNLRWEDVDLKERSICVRCKEGFITKTKEFRIIPMNEKLHKEIEEYKNNSKNPKGYIFVSADSKKGFRWDFIKPFKQALKISGITRRFRFHDLRHTFISNLIMKGVDILTVSRLSGHSSIRMIDKVYGHLRDEHLRSAVEKL